MIFKLFCVFLVIGCAFTKEAAKLPVPCGSEDVACLNKAKKEFLKIAAAGISNYGLKAFDPLVIPSFKVDVENGTVEFKNLTVVGFMNEEITNSKLDRAAKVMTVTSKQNLKFDADLHVEFPKRQKKYSGKYDATAAAVLTSSYNYELKTDEKGEHLHFISESVNCEPDVKVVKDINLENAIRNDTEVGNKKYEGWYKNISSEIACKIIQKGLETIFFNFKVFKITYDNYPISAFYTDFPVKP